MKTGGRDGARPGRGRPSSFRIARSSFCIRPRSGFTLLELVMVMLILSMLLAMVAPSLSGFGAGRDAEYAAAQVMTLSRWAREQAITEGRVYRLNFDPSTQTYQVTEQVGGTFQEIRHDFGRVFSLPEGVTMAWQAPQEAGVYVIDFHPSGRAQPARIQVTARNGTVSFVGSRTPTELLRVMSPEEALTL
jgi:type II secretion system protein H